MSIAGFSVRNTVLVTILLVTLLVFGAFSLQRLPREQFSEVPFYWVNVIVPYPGVAAEDVEQTVTIPLETEFSGIDKLKRIQSVTSEGLSLVRVEFEDGINNTEFQRLFQEVRTRYAKVNLPEGTLQALIDDFSSSDFLPVIEIIVYGEAGYNELSRQAKILSDRIKKIPEVSGADMIGYRDRQILLEADRRSLESLGLSLNEVIRAVQVQNVSVPGGILQTESRDYLLRTLGRAENVNAFSDIVLRGGNDSASGAVRVRDVAEVVEGFDSRGIYARFNGEESISIRVSKVSGGNSISVIDSVKTEIEDFRKGLGPGIEIELSGDSTVQIRDSISVLLNNAFFGLILLSLILYLFVGFRNALMTALGIPVTFAITFIILELLGETFNTNTLFGMVLVLGLIVDHAIVITENSYRLTQEGLSKREAAIAGADQVIVPVIAATLTTVAAFLPLMILPGTIGKFLRVIPLTVSIALIASTFEAVIFLPSHFAEWPGGEKKAKRDFFEPLKQKYQSFISRIYRRKGLAVIIMTVIVLALLSLTPFLNQDLFSAEDFTLFYIDLELAPGSPVSKTSSIVEAYEERITPLIGNGEIVSVISYIGFSSGSSGNTAKSNVAQIIVDLTEQKEGRKRSITAIMSEVRDLTGDIPGLENVQFRKAQNGPPTDSPVSFRLFGNNLEHLGEISEILKARLSTYPELFNISDNLEKNTPEFRITLKPDRAAAFGLDPFTVGSFIRDSIEGRTVTTYFKDNVEIDVIVKYAPSGQGGFLGLEQMLIPAPGGRQIPFSSVAVIEQGSSLASIKRLDGKRELTITSEAYTKENVRSINREINTLFQTELSARYPDVELNVGGEFAELSNLLIQILRVFLIGVFLIYIILGTQFKSYTQPILILLTIPFALAGVVIYLFISGTPFSTTVLYAGVALAGIAVNDSIVLISFINELRQKGSSVKEAVTEAAVTRFRPIMLTSLTTIAGLMPTALGIGGKSVVWGPMASTIIFGLVFSTFTALVFIPSLYGLLYGRGDNKRLTEEK